jgi:hypothetical protein
LSRLKQTTRGSLSESIEALVEAIRIAGGGSRVEALAHQYLAFEQIEERLSMQ